MTPGVPLSMKPSGWKRIVVACDGTWNRQETAKPGKYRPTNVLKLLRAIEAVDKSRVVQVMEYVRGIGTGNILDLVLGGATGAGISANIEQAYQFIANNYRHGDDIYLFGFSRGAFTARSLSGFLHHLGILKKDQLHRFPEAYLAYQTTPKAELQRLGEEFGSRRINDVISIPIHFIGVWDTVGALGVVDGVTDHWVKFHDTELAPNVSHAYHALAIHEFRSDFLPTLWTHKNGGQIVEQVWFSGAHSDVGGGGDDSGLSDVALDWMMKRAASINLELTPNGTMAPDDNGIIDLSYSNFYLLKNSIVRDIGQPSGVNQFIHHSVSTRTKPTLPGGPFSAFYEELFDEADLMASSLPSI